MPSNAADPLLSTVRLDPGPDLAAAVPHLLGFAPRESLVLVSLTGERTRRVGVTLRVDLPPPGLEDVLAAEAVRSLAATGPSATVVLLVTEAPDDLGPAVRPWGVGDDLSEAMTAPVPGLPGRGLLAEVVARLAEAGIVVLEALLVRSGRCWSYDCDQPCCAPGAGRPLPGGTSPLAAASAFSGQVLAASREELVDRLRPVSGSRARSMAEACAWVGAEHAALLEAHGWEHAVETSWAHVQDALARCVPGAATPLGDHDVARVGFALVDGALRDRALSTALGPDAAAAEALWTELVRRLPPPLDATPATLLAVTAWSRGDGVTAGTALDRALTSRPDHPLAQLLRSALEAALPPAGLRRLGSEAASGAPLTSSPSFRAAPDAPSPHRARGRRGTR